MAGKLNIPTPAPEQFRFKIFGAKPAAYNPSFISESQVRPPAPFNASFNPAIVNAGILTAGANAAEQLIASYLGNFPSPFVNAAPQYTIPPAPQNDMQTYPGNALAATVFSNIEFEGANYTDFSGQTKGFDTLIFNTVLIDVKQRKNIVETNIQGSDTGAVFEYSGMGSYDVTFHIIIVADNQNGVYPQSEGLYENGVEDIIKMLESPVSIKVNNWYLQMLNIYEVVVTDYEIGQTEGGISQQPITINARSNQSASLVIQSNSTAASG